MAAIEIKTTDQQGSPALIIIQPAQTIHGVTTLYTRTRGKASPGVIVTRDVLRKLLAALI